MNDLASEIAVLRSEVHELKGMIEQLLSPAQSLSIAEKARMIREAHATGNRKVIRAITQKINGTGGAKNHAKKRQKTTEKNTSE